MLLNGVLITKLFINTFASCYFTNLEFLNLHLVHFDSTINLQFFDLKVFEFKLSVFFLYLTQQVFMFFYSISQ